MAKSKKLLSVLLSVALLISSIFVGGVVSANTGLNLYTTTNTYDDEGVQFINTNIENNPGTYVNSETKNNNFAVYNTQIQEFDDTQGYAARFNKATHPSDEKWRALVRIYEQGDADLKQFKPKANTTYELKLKYFVATKPTYDVKIQVVEASYQQISYQNNDYQTDRILADVFTVTEQTNEWVEVSVKFTAPSSPKYLCLGTCSSTGNWVSNVDVWVDDVVVSECGTVNIHNYNGTNTQTADVTANTTVGELSVPEIKGMLFDGVYADAEFSRPLNSTDKAADYTNIYYKWKLIGYGEYYVGFENYIDLKNVISLADNAAVVTSGAFAGNSALELDLSEYKYSAFELRDENSIDVIANHKYKVAFKYKATEAIKVSAGMGLSFDLPTTAYSLTNKRSLSACAKWSVAEVELVADHSLTDGYALALLVSSENGVEVYFDDIYITDITDKTADTDLSFDLPDDWYPTINTVDIWDGETIKAPGDANQDTIYEITNGAELAYIIKNGDEGKSYILKNDIYLNDITKINWQTGVANGYTPNSWYTYYNSDGFYGSIDGNGHIVYGLYFEKNPSSYVSGTYGAGLIPFAVSGQTTAINNLGIDYAYINYEGAASAFIGDLKDSATATFSECFVGENVSIKGGSAGAFCGRTGSSAAVSLTNCYSLASAVVAYDSYTAGIAGVPRGNSTAITVNNSFNAKGAIFSSYYTAPRTANNSYQSVAGTTSNEKVLTLDNMQGETALTSPDKMSALNASDVFVAGEGFPRLKKFVKAESVPQAWKGDTTEPSDTDGDGIIEIGKASELAYIVANKGVMNGTSGHTFVLTNDIYLNDITKINWSTGAVSQGYIANSWYSSDNSSGFVGTIDGQGHTVYGLYYRSRSYSDAASYSAALIPVAGGAVTIKNLAIDSSFIKYEYTAAAFVGAVTQSKTENPVVINIENCCAESNTYILGVNAAVFRGYQQYDGSTTNITNCYSLANLSANGGSQGLVASMYGNSNIKNTFTSSQITTNANSDTVNYYLIASNVYEGVASGVTITGVTAFTDLKYMKGDDVLTNPNKMPLLENASVFVPRQQDFANHDYYTYLPEGTVIEGNYSPSFYEHFINSALAPVDSQEVLFGNTMTRGAYVKFGAKPNVEDILIPTDKHSQVVQGTAEEVLLNREYYDIEFDVISENLASQTSSAVNYIFITDIHYPGDNTAQKNALIRQMQLICEMANKNENIDFIAVGGDIVEGYDSKKTMFFERIQEILEPLTSSTKPVLVAAGNHDDNCYGDFTSPEEKVASNLDWNRNVIDYIVNPTTNDGIKQDKDYNNKEYNSRYYYYDIVGKKTRIVVLDSSNYPQSYNGDGNVTLYLNKEYTAGSPERNKYINGYNYYGYSKAQLQWLANEALTAEDGWNYMFISHMGIDKATNIADAVVNYGSELRDIIKSYQTKTPYINGELGINKDWSNTSGKILSYHFGHVHGEKSLYSDDIELWQFSSSTAKSEDEFISTPDELCFDVISVTQANIAKQNLGRGENNRFVVAADITKGDVNNDFVTDICDLVSVSNFTDNIYDAKVSFLAADLKKDCLINANDLEEIRKIIIGR